MRCRWALLSAPMSTHDVRLIAIPWKIFQDHIAARRVENSSVTRVRDAHAERANTRLINNRVSDK